MSITTDLNVWWADHQSYIKSNAVKAAAQNLVNTTAEMVATFSAMNAAGDFDQLPVSGKDAAFRILQKYNAADKAVKDDKAAQEFLGWAP